MPNPCEGKQKKKKKKGGGEQAARGIEVNESECDFERMWPASLLSPNEILSGSKSFSALKRKKEKENGKGGGHYIYQQENPIHHIRSLL